MPKISITVIRRVVSSTLSLVGTSVSSPGFPEPETRFFHLTNPGILKILELLLHSNISDSDNIELADWGRLGRNGQISTFELQLLS